MSHEYCVVAAFLIGIGLGFFLAISVVVAMYEFGPARKRA